MFGFFFVLTSLTSICQKQTNCKLLLCQRLKETSLVSQQMESLEGGELCFPHLLNTSCRTPTAHRPPFILTRSLMTLMSLLTAALNLLVIISISHFRQRSSSRVHFVHLNLKANVQRSFPLNTCFLSPRRLHSPTNLLILSLAVSDFLVGTFATLSVWFLTDSCWYFGEFMCATFCIFNVIIASSSVGNMVLISIDRFLAICDPLHYPIRVTIGRTKICICLCWVCSILYNCLILNNFLEDPNTYNSCYGECVLAFNNVIGTVDFFCTLIAPVATIIVLYTRVFSVALSQARAMRVSHNASGPVSVKLQKSELKAAITLGVVVLVFLICFPPYFFPYLAGQDIKINDSSVSFTVYLLYFNSCLNPVIYALFYPWFRKSVKLILTLKILRTRPC